MAEIMYEINNSPKFKTFQSRERFIRLCFQILIIAIHVVGLFAYVVHSNPDKENNHYLNWFDWQFLIIFHRYAPNFIILPLALILLYNLKKYYYFEYKRQWFPILCFTFFQTFIIASELMEESTLKSKITRGLYWQGYYLIYLSVGYVFLKSVRDPFESISYLGYMQLVSIN